MSKLNKLNLWLALVVLGTMLFVTFSILNHNKYQTTEVSLPTTGTVSTIPSPTVALSKRIVTRLNLEPEEFIFLNSEIDDTSVSMVINRIQQAEQSGQTDLYIGLDCPGGSVFDGARLIAYMDASPVRVHTIVYGLAASMCAQIAAHGKVRYGLDYATLMYHLASGGVSGNVKGMKSLLTYIDRTVKKLDAYIVSRSKMSSEEFESVMTTDLWIDSGDALDKGLIDKLAVVNVSGHSVQSMSIANKTTREKVVINPLKDIY